MCLWTDLTACRTKDSSDLVVVVAAVVGGHSSLGMETMLFGLLRSCLKN